MKFDLITFMFKINFILRYLYCLRSDQNFLRMISLDLSSYGDNFCPCFSIQQALCKQYNHHILLYSSSQKADNYLLLAVSFIFLSGPPKNFLNNKRNLKVPPARVDVELHPHGTAPIF